MCTVFYGVLLCPVFVEPCLFLVFVCFCFFLVVLLDRLIGWSFGKDCLVNPKSNQWNSMILLLQTSIFCGNIFLLALDHQISQTKDCLWSYRLRSWLRLMMDPVHIPASHAAGYPVAFSRRWLEKWHRRSGGRCPMTGAALDLKERSFGECPAGWRLSVKDKVIR